MTFTSVERYTEAEYLEREVAASQRSEYRNGEIVEMAGGTPDHNELSIALVSLLRTALKGQPFRTFALDQRLWVPGADLHTYPDAMVTARPPELKAGRKDTLINPVLIAEVLSDSTQDYDRGGKFAAYRTIETLQEYVLISQHAPQVEHYVKQASNQWLLTEHVGLENSLTLRFSTVKITLSDLYTDINFL